MIPAIRISMLAAGLACPAIGLAQSVDDNVVADASDAFGQSVGNERIGLYSADDVRGFSPVDAGNTRIQGLYFAPVDRLPNGLAQGSSVRVGIAAQGYSFPAPTGIVDYNLAVNGEGERTLLVLERAQFGSLLANLDTRLQLAENLRAHAGVIVRRQNRHEGGNFKAYTLSGGMEWRSSGGASLTGFYGFTRTYDDEAAPSIFPGGNYLPPQIARREMIGQSWSKRDNSQEIYGGIAKLPLAQWELEAGLFRAERRVDSNFTDLFGQMRPDGTTPDRVMVVDVDNRDRAISGEVKLVRTFGSPALAHRVTASLRGKRVNRVFGGAQRISLGESSLWFADERPVPAFAFGPDDTDEVELATLGLGYSIVRPGRFSVDLALASSRYSKSLLLAAVGTPVFTHDKPLTGSLTATLDLSGSLTVYGGHVRGFEEVGAAPANAANRGSAPPAIGTQQSDLGLRYRVLPGLNLVAGVFSISKPYYNLDNTSIYRRLGSSSSRGLEISLAGTLRPGLTIVAGTVLLDAKVSGDLVASGAIGSRPVGSVRRRSTINLDWRPGNGASPLSFDLRLESFSKRVGNASNLLMAPARETIDIGLRYRFDLGRAKALARIQIANLLDDYGWQVSANGAFQYSHGRRVLAELRFELP